jgi:hypothetical protein
MESRIKLDPLAYMLILGVLGLQIYSSFLSHRDVEAAISESDQNYQTAVFSSAENRGVMHQVFRQNEIDRELLKAVLRVCAK